MNSAHSYPANDGLPLKRHAYARAARHSVRVRLFKKLIPVGAGLALALILLTAFVDPFNRLRGLSLGAVSLNGTKIAMENPKLTGFKKDQKPYEVTAIQALQDVRKPNVVELKNLRARVTMDEASFARLESSFGIFDTQKEKLDLQHDVRVKTDSGYDVTMKSALIDFKAGTVLSQEPVRVGLTNGLIEADTLDVSDNGKMIVFQGRVHARFDNAMPASSSDKSALKDATP